MKIIKKIKIIFAIIILLYSAIFIPKNRVVKAEAITATTTVLALNSWNPAVWPVIIVGLVAVVVLGLAIENREEIQALGQAVSVELGKMGASIYDFVSGTSVKVDSRLKQAIFNAADGMGNTLPGVSIGSVSQNGNVNIYNGGVTDKSIALYKPNAFSGRIFLLGKSKRLPNLYNKDTDIAVSSLSITVNIQPITSSKSVTLDFDFYSGGTIKPISSSINKDEAGNVISITQYYASSKSSYDDYIVANGIFLRTGKYSGKYNVTSFTIPELGVNVTAPEVPITKVRENEYDRATREKVAGTVFPGTAETLTFRPDVNVADVTALNLPNISDKVYDGATVKTLEDIQLKSKAEERVDTETITGVGTGALNLSGLWDWLKKILEAILGLPAAIIGALQGLWQLLMDLLNSILKALQGLATSFSTAILDGLKALFGVDTAWFNSRVNILKLRFNEKFPSIQPINYRFTDKNQVSDITVNLPGFGRQTVVSGAMVTEFATVVKIFLRGLFYMLLALFFFRKFHKTAEG